MPAPRARVLSLPLALGLVVAACGSGIQVQHVRTPGCVPIDRTPTEVTLHMGHAVPVPQPCPRAREGAIRGPVLLTATREGLRIQFGVYVATYSPGPYRDEGGERDAVVVFPRDTGPGQPSHQLNTLPAPGGYNVDDVVPWSAWDLTEPVGAFRLTVAVFDNYAGGFTVQTRFTVHVVLAPNS